MPRRLCLVSTLVAALPGTARSECPPDAVFGAVSARMDSSLVEFLATALYELPAAIDIPETPFVLADCPDGFDDTAVTPRDALARLRLRKAEIKLDQDAIIVQLGVDVDAHADLEMSLCALPDATCAAELLLKDAQVSARLKPSARDCRLQVDLSETAVSLNPNGLSMALTDCGVYGELWDVVSQWYRDTMLTRVSEALEQAVMEKLPTVLSDVTHELLHEGMETNGVHFRMGIQQIQVDADGIEVVFAASAQPQAPEEACVPSAAASFPPPTRPPTTPVTDAGPWGRGPLYIAASKAFVDRVAWAGWRAGWLCFDSREHDLDLGSFVHSVAPEARVEARVRPGGLPSVELGLEAAPVSRVRLGVAPLVAEVQVDLPGAGLSTLLVQGNAVLEAAVSFDPDQQAFVIMPTAIANEELELKTAAGPIAFAKESVHGFVRDLVLPAFTTHVGALWLRTGTLVKPPLAVRVDHLDISPTQLGVALALARVDPNDRTPPETALAEDPPGACRPDLILVMDPHDDRTPRAFVRHSVTIDGVAEEALRAGTHIAVSGLTAGWHRVTIAAVDLAGNRDPTPLEIPMLVDDLEPEIAFTTAPFGVIASRQAVVRFVSRDETTPPEELAIHYELGLVSRNPEPDLLLASGKLSNPGELQLTDLPEDTIVRLTLYARDAAGNQGSVSTSFAVNAEPTFDCSAVHPWPSGLMLLGLAAAIERWRRRLRDRRSRSSHGARSP